jgi:hypothetical protein
VELAGRRDERAGHERRARAVALVGDGDHFRAHAPIVPLGPGGRGQPDGRAGESAAAGGDAGRRVPSPLDRGGRRAPAPVNRFAQYAKLMSSVRTFCPVRGEWMKRLSPM